MSKITLLIHCPDTSGIIAHVTSFFYKRQGNIIYIDQYVDVENTVFFMRLECEFNSQTSIKITKDEFRETVAKQYKMSWQMYSASAKPRMAVFVSKYDHCLYDILSRYKSNELEVDIPLIISNHIDLEHVAQSFGIPFYHIPVTARNREEAAESQLALLKKEKVDFIVLARYMQIIPKSLIAAFPNRIINIHHSFLPAFAGAKPYHLAYKRGVKIIGATSHYVTEELDAGPIIEQDITRISHSHSLTALILKGRALEKIVLAKGIKYHIERKTLVFNNKTIVFT